MAPRHHHRPPNPQLQSRPRPKRSNQRRRGPRRKRLAHINQSAETRYLRLENPSEKYPQPNCRNVVEYLEIPTAEYFLRNIFPAEYPNIFWRHLSDKTLSGLS